MPYAVNIRAAIGAGATVANALAGTSLEFMGEPAMLDVYGNADIVGMVMSLSGFRGANPGEQLIPPGSALHLASTVGAVKKNEDFIGTFSVPAGSRLVLPVTNPGAASNFNFDIVVR